MPGAILPPPDMQGLGLNDGFRRVNGLQLRPRLGLAAVGWLRGDTTTKAAAATSPPANRLLAVGGELGVSLAA